MGTVLQKYKQYLLTGVSYAIPFIACGGILIAASIAFVPIGPEGPDFTSHPTWELIFNIGNTSFSLMLPVLAGYIAYAMASKPGLVPGFVGGLICHEINAGFLGAIFSGLLAGHLVNLIKKMPVPALMKPIMPIIIIPALSSLIIGGVILKVVGVPIANFMEALEIWLESVNQGSSILLALILGGMIAFDMGGPVNKAAFFFGAAMIEQGNYYIMGTVAAAIATPPLGMGLATLIDRKLWNQRDRETGAVSLGMGMMGLTEGAIPFAAADPLRVIPCIMVGSMVAAIIAMLAQVGNYAPHGGPIVLPVINNKLMYVLAIVAGAVVTACLINLLKKISKSNNLSQTGEPQ